MGWNIRYSGSRLAPNTARSYAYTAVAFYSSLRHKSGAHHPAATEDDMRKVLLVTAALVALPVVAQAQMQPNPGFYIGAEAA
jgi:hypothetical protein